MDARVETRPASAPPDSATLRTENPPVGDAETAVLVRRQPRGWLSPINRRRWENFKANRRGYWSFWLFLILFIVSLGSEFIASDKPFYVRADGKSYFPAL